MEPNKNSTFVGKPSSSNIPTIHINSRSNSNSANNSTSNLNKEPRNSSVRDAMINIKPGFSLGVSPRANPNSTNNNKDKGQQQSRPKPIYSQVQVLPRSLHDIIHELPASDNNEDAGPGLSRHPFNAKTVSFDSVSVKVSQLGEGDEYADHRVPFDSKNELSPTRPHSNFSGLTGIDSKTASSKLKGQKDFVKNVGIVEDSLIKNYTHHKYSEFLRDKGKGRSFVVVISGRKHTWVALDYTISKLLTDGDHLIVMTRIPEAFRGELLKETAQRQKFKNRELGQARSKTRSVKSNISDDDELSDDDGNSKGNHIPVNEEDIDPQICLQLSQKIKDYIHFMMYGRNLVIKLSVEIYLSTCTKKVLCEILKVHTPQFIVTSSKPSAKFSESNTWKSSRISDRLVQFSGVPVIVVPALKSDIFEFKLWASMIKDYNISEADHPEKKLMLKDEHRLRTKLELLKTSRATDDFVKKNLKDDDEDLESSDSDSDTESDSDSSYSRDSDSDSDRESRSISDEEDESQNLRGRRRDVRPNSPSSSKKVKSRDSSVGLEKVGSGLSLAALRRKISRVDGILVGDESQDSEDEDNDGFFSDVSSDEASDASERNVFVDEEFQESSLSSFNLKKKLKREELRIKEYIQTHTPSAEPHVFMDVLSFISTANHNMSETLKEMLEEDSQDPESAKLARSMTGLPEIAKAKSMLDFTDPDEDHKNHLDRKLEFLNYHKGQSQSPVPGPPSAASKSIKFGDAPTPSSTLSTSTGTSSSAINLRRLKSSADIAENGKRPDLHPIKSTGLLQFSKNTESKLSLASSGTSTTSNNSEGTDSKKKKSFFKRFFKK